MNDRMKEPCVVFGDNIDTDQIVPGRYLELTDPKEIGSHCFSGIDEAIAPSFPKGGIVVAGRNFGCGSSREHAPIAILNMGCQLLLAESFARIFFRNAINLGLAAVECPGLAAQTRTGDVLDVDLLKGVVINETTGKRYSCRPIDAHSREILEAGGIKPLMRARFSKDN